MHVILVHSCNYVKSLSLGFELSHFFSSSSIDSGCLMNVNHPTVVDSSFENIEGVFNYGLTYACAFCVFLKLFLSLFLGF